MLPFTVDEFLGVFTAYNTGVWPAPIVLGLAALGAVYVVLRRGSPLPVLVVLALLWTWAGAVYHVGYFSGINPAANVFGALFVAQGALFAWQAFRGRLAFDPWTSGYGPLGGLLVLYALLLYPLVGLAAGHAYPGSPTFGAPCPVTIFTFGVLLWTTGRVPVHLLAIPLAWSLMGASAAVSLGMVEDWALPVAGIAATALLVWRNRQARGVDAVVRGPAQGVHRA